MAHRHGMVGNNTRVMTESSGADLNVPTTLYHERFFGFCTETRNKTNFNRLQKS